MLTVRTADSAGAFFDDQWSLTKRLTVNLGLRFDRMTTKYGRGRSTSSPPPPPRSTTLRPSSATAPDSGNIFDFKTWSPRIGLSYTLTADDKTVARAALRPLLHADHRRVPEAVRPRHAPL